MMFDPFLEDQIIAADDPVRSLSYFLTFVVGFVLFGTTCALLNFCLYLILFDIKKQTHRLEDFWKFYPTLVLNILLLVLYVTGFDNFRVIFSSMVLVYLFIIAFIKANKSKLIAIFDHSLIGEESVDYQKHSLDLNRLNQMDNTINRLSVNTFRAKVILISIVAISSVDFSIFPEKHMKRNYFGLALMDIGVGSFIMCHSMRLIRNDYQNTLMPKSTKNRMFQVVKKSSIILFFGLLRTFLILAFSYHQNPQEYGVHWNFFYTIFFVKVLSCPFERVIKESALRSFLLASLIGLVYQYFLNFHGLLDFVLKNERDNWLEYNKEGLISTIGYLSLSFYCDSCCYRIKHILNKKCRLEEFDKFKLTQRCWIELTMFFILFLSMDQLSRFVLFGEASRRACNLSFIYFIMTTNMLIWCLALLVGIVTSRTILNMIESQTRTRYSSLSEATIFVNKSLNLLHAAFYCYELLDSKFMGISVFMISNYVTGFMNLVINDTRSLSAPCSLLIILTNCILSTFIPCFVYYRLNYKRVIKNAYQTSKSDAI